MSGQPVQRPVPPPPSGYRPPQPKPQPQRKNKAGQAIVILAVLLLLLSLIFTPLGPLILGPLMGQSSYPASSTFTLVRTVEIDISQGEIEYVLELPVPKDLTHGLEVVQEISYHDTFPSASTSSKYGYDWVQWTGVSDEPVEFSITTTATVNTLIWDIDSTNSGYVEDIPASMDYQLNNEWALVDDDNIPTGEYKIWPSNPTIRSLARSLTSETATTYENVESIYNYIRDNIDYEVISRSSAKVCLETLSDGTGDCDDQTILLISLCRSIGIPSWMAFGSLYDAVTDDWGPHAWAEIYIPMFDGSASIVTIDPANGDFLVRNSNRLEEWKSDGNGDHLDDYYHLLSYNYTLRGDQQPPIVILDDSYSGIYESSGRINAGYIELIMIRKD